MRTSRQFVGTLGPSQSARWYTFNWPASWHVLWYVTPTTPQRGGPQLDWDVSVERADTRNVTYWITVKNLTGRTVRFEGRYAVLNA